MTDHELLELAAKAAGMPKPFDDNDVWSAWVGSPESGHWWDPLTDDGDALRLAIALRLTLHLELPRIGIGPRTDFPEVWVEDDQNDDEEVRRAIVRAAAQIGQAM